MELSRMVNRTPVWGGFALLLLLAGLGGCREELPADRLYALYLDQPPTVADWERALPRTVTVKGGRVHRQEPLADIDQDTVHTSTASCHHGATLPDPLPVDLRAFYTDADLYLRVSWPDATRDDSMLAWEFDGATWDNLGGLEDGLGLLWNPGRDLPGFTCSYACHIDDFGVSGASFHARNRMKLAREGAWLDLWNWKADRTARLGFADDRYLDGQGMHGDLPGELFVPNSRYSQALEEGRKPFGDGDGPIYDAEGVPVGGEFRAPGSRAPGYLAETPGGGRADVAARGTWQDGRWTVVLRRALETGKPRDVVFVPGDRQGTAFGLSVMDNTLDEHFASVTEERLMLLPRTAGSGG